MTDWIANVIEQHGYWAIAFLMFAENVFPPIPSELIMPFAGFAAGRGSLTLAGVVVAGTVGSLAGTLPWYLLGRRLGAARLDRLAERHGRWLTSRLPTSIMRSAGSRGTGIWPSSQDGWCRRSGASSPCLQV